MTDKSTEILRRFDSAALEFERASNTAYSLFELMWSRGDHSGEVEVSYSRIGAAGVAAMQGVQDAFQEMSDLANDLRRAQP